MKNIYLSYDYKLKNDDFLYHLSKELEIFGYKLINNPFDESWQEYSEKISSSIFLINKSDIFIAIIRETNPNIFFELGYATALGKKTLVILDDEISFYYLRNHKFNRFDFNSTNVIYEILNLLEKIVVEEIEEKPYISYFSELVKEYRSSPLILDKISSQEFENIIFDYLTTQGFEPEKTTNLDYGYDFILRNYHGFSKTLVEIKKYSVNNKVSVNVVQQLYGAINAYEADHGILITTSGFTSSALDIISSLNIEMELWDMDFLSDMFPDRI